MPTTKEVETLLADIRARRVRPTVDQWRDILEAHVAWLGGGTEGCRANLTDANLTDADLRGANLTDARIGRIIVPQGARLLQIGPLGSRLARATLMLHATGISVATGCFSGTADEFMAAVQATHGDNKHARDYRAMIEFARALQYGLDKR